jgi:hypothetical protein
MKLVKVISAIILVLVMSISVCLTAHAEILTLNYSQGEVKFRLKEPYTGPSVTELFPELNISKVEDWYQKDYDVWVSLNQSSEASLEARRKNIGTLFIITLEDQSTSAVLEAVKIIEQNPLVESAEPNYINIDFIPGEIVFRLKYGYKRTESTIADLLPDYEIAEVKDIYYSYYKSGLDSGNVDFLEEMEKQIGTCFHIKLVNQSTGAVINAMNILWQNPIVAYADPNYLVSSSSSYQTATPAISPKGGEFTYKVPVTIACDTAGADIYFTTNGMYPTTNSTKYTGAIELTDTTTIKAISVKRGMVDCEAIEVTFTKVDEEPYTPGDISGNGILDFGDVGLLLNHILGIYELTDPIMLRNADINKDGILGFDDIGIMLLRLGLVIQ